MENLVKKISATTTAWIVLVLIVLSLASLLLFKLNLGPEFSSARVIVAQLDHEESLKDIESKANEIIRPAAITKESTSKFYFYFQNTNELEITAFADKFAEVQPGVLTVKDYNFSYSGEIFIVERVIIIAVIALIIHLVYVAITFKDTGLKRMDLLPLLSVELFSLGIAVLLLFGVGSALGELGLVMDSIYWVIFLIAVAIVIIFRIYVLLRYRDMLKKQSSNKFVDVYKQMFKKYWPEFVFIFCLAIIVCVLPLTVLGTKYLLAAILVLVAILFSIFNFIFLERYFLEFLQGSKFLSEEKIKSKSSLLKKW